MWFWKFPGHSGDLQDVLEISRTSWSSGNLQDGSGDFQNHIRINLTWRCSRYAATSGKRDVAVLEISRTVLEISRTLQKFPEHPGKTQNGSGKIQNGSGIFWNRSGLFQNMLKKHRTVLMEKQEPLNKFDFKISNRRIWLQSWIHLKSNGYGNSQNNVLGSGKSQNDLEIARTIWIKSWNLFFWLHPLN